MVEVFCPLEICRQRNIKRGDRAEDQSDWQDKLMAKDIQYDCSVNTHVNSSEECADSILKCLYGRSEY
ncbi:phosphotransferase-like protein [Paenibacillus lautus]|uniref:phosphotransferase-like protein n=1 Tax=Paenibacillus lautus TaxID=1401 RepID=UPI003D9A91E7